MPGSFGFRLACYQEFGWGPEQVKDLQYSEVLLLAVYFEELARKRRKDDEKLKRQLRAQQGSGTMQAAGPHERVVTEFEVTDDDEEESEDEV